MLDLPDESVLARIEVFSKKNDGQFKGLKFCDEKFKELLKIGNTVASYDVESRWIHLKKGERIVGMQSVYDDKSST